MSSDEIVEAAELGQGFAEPAEPDSRGALVLAETKPLAEQLISALEMRVLVDQALGVLMGRTGMTEVDALDQLHSLSRARQRAFGVVAGEVVQEAIRSAGLARYDR